MNYHRRPQQKRLGTKLAVKLDRLKRPESILGIVIPILFSFLILILLAYFVVNLSYKNKIVYSIDDVPAEHIQSVILLDYQDIIDEEEEFLKIMRVQQELYLERRISNIIFYVINADGDFNEIENIIKNNSGRTKSEIIETKVNFGDEKVICKDLKENKISKAILFAKGDRILRGLYLCNFFNLYYTGYKIDQSETIGDVEFIEFNTFINDLVNTMIYNGTK
jgi:vancomycin permeability regulator SanA